MQVCERAQATWYSSGRSRFHLHADGAGARDRDAGAARIGAIHSVIFAGFSAEAIADRNRDAAAKLQITADIGWRRGKALPLKETVDEALAKSPTVQKCVVYRRGDAESSNVNMQTGRDFWWDELMQKASDECPAASMDSEAPLFILYTSGSTGKPKGIKHTTAGYSLFAKKTFEWVFDHRDDDVFWCTADIGWVTGHSYVVYGPLAAGATILMYEGAPNSPDESRFWQLIEKYKVTIFYTAPTAIRAFIKWGDHHVAKHDLSSLRLLGTVGEGINPEAWMWYHRVIGKERCPIVDTWWQTETGGIMMSPLPGAIATKPGSCTKPLPGIIPAVVGHNSQPCPKIKAGGWSSRIRGPACCAAFGAMMTASKKCIGRKFRACIWRVTTRGTTMTATTGSWGGSMMS